MNKDKMNKDKKVTIGERGLTTPGNGVATIGTPGRRDAGTPFLYLGIGFV